MRSEAAIRSTPGRAAALATALVLLLPLGALQAALPSDARPWLEKMLSAQTEASYEGEMVYTHGEVMSTLGVVRRVGPQGVEERLFALDGAPREVVRSGKRLACDLQPGQQLEMTRHSSPGARTALVQRVSELGDYYRVTLGGRQRIANRDTQRIDLMPTGDYRYGHRLWLDADTGLPLKTQLVDAGKRVLEQVMFTEIHYLDPPTDRPDDGQADSFTADSETSADIEPPAPFRPSAWRVDQLPRGFRLSSNHQLDNDGDSVEHLVFSDGLATVSVFIEEMETNTERGFRGISQQGTVTLYGRTHSGHQVTVIGEVPELTLRHIGDSLRSVDAGP